MRNLYHWILTFLFSQADEEATRKAKTAVDELLNRIHKTSEEAANSGLLDKEKYVIPPHLHDLQEADLPETQRGLVMTEIAQFRERAAKREREKMRDVQAAVPSILGAPSGPKQREWGKPAAASPSPQTTKPPQPLGKSAQGYSKPVGFVKAEEQSGSEDRAAAGKSAKTDEELEADRKEARRRDEENSFRDVSSLCRLWIPRYNLTVHSARTKIRTSRENSYSGSRTVSSTRESYSRSRGTRPN